MDELKPCPFCGGKAKLYVHDGVRVLCTKCGATSMSLEDYYNGLDIKSNAVRDVIAAWNRRVNDGND